ncbi:BslA/BslB family hydrophobin [Psychrobacillus sp. FSL K6-2843]|uniref:BslA/BslB family hydrophobin n=1 Tax=Psychrobacillus sp. FSL K6-2843 TaxID=2921549 RepID=UPI00315AD277
MVLKSASYTSGQATTIRLDYYTDTLFVNGTLTIQLPSEITVTTADNVNFGVWRSIAASEISADGHTLTFTGINTSGDFAIQLDNKLIPTQGSYDIFAQADADGSENSYSADTETVTLISQ